MNTGLKKFLIALVCVVVLAVAILVIVISTYHGEHVYDHSCDVDCNVCGEIRTDIVHQLETVEGYDPTCTEEGLRAYEVCKNCGYSTRSDEHVIAPKGHNLKDPVEENRVEATCVDNGSYESVVYCADCNEEISRNTIVVNAHGNHIYKVVPAKAATCLEGWYEHEKCDVCGDIKGYDSVPVIPAAYEHISSVHPIVYAPSVVDPTCTTKGSYMMAVCCTNDNCDYIFPEVDEDGNIIRDENGNEVIKLIGPIDIPMIPHTIVKNDAVAPTCTTNGMAEHYKCSECKKCFGVNENGTIEIKEAGETIKLAEIDPPKPIEALGHQNVEYTEAKAPTCTSDGNKEYWTCKTCNGVFADKNYTIATTVKERYMPATGHKEITNTDDESITSPTCVTDGGYDVIHSCSVCGVVLSREHIIDPATGHIPPKNDDNRYPEECFVIENLVEPTCTETGSYDRVVYCGTCGDEISRENWIVPEVEHNKLSKVEAKAPSCTEAGHEEYYRCSKCGYYDEDDVVEIPAIGRHSDITNEEIDNESITSPTCVTDGGYDIIYNCSVCGAELSRTHITVPALGHNYDANGYCQNGSCTDRISVGFSFKLDGGYTITGLGSCSDTEVIIPSEINGIPVIAIAEDAFKNSNIKSVVIPDSVKSIGKNAFFYCDSLESVVIGDGVEEIGAFAFFYCDSLTSVTIGSGVKSIGNGAFNYCPISVVYYQGTAAQWNSISIAGNNSALTGATRKYI